MTRVWALSTIKDGVEHQNEIKNNYPEKQEHQPEANELETLILCDQTETKMTNNI